MKKKILLFTALSVFAIVTGFFLLRHKGDVSRQQDNPARVNARAGSPDDRNGGSPAPVSGAMMRKNADAGGASARKSLELLEEWLALQSRKDGMTAATVAQSLTRVLHGSPTGNREFYGRAKQILADVSISMDVKLQLIDLLSRAATLPAVQLFADLCAQELPPVLKQAVYNAISQTGEYYWDVGSASAASPILLQLWQQARDPMLLSALAAAMARTGNPEALNSLFDSVLGAGGSLADIQKSGDPRVSAAWSALVQMHSPEAIPYIAARLERADATPTEIAICAGKLALMGGSEAPNVLLAWARGAGDSYAALARDAFARIQDRESLDILYAANIHSADFKSNLVKQAVLSSLKKP